MQKKHVEITFLVVEACSRWQIYILVDNAIIKTLRLNKMFKFVSVFNVHVL